ncbi:hypothetical protein [Streptomyces sp. NPDC049915]|uniref:hypothetical protein n=1 Tax=Streptomyces sp. NPDC049915 TaxID=3155510 RepID=UPI003419580B
MRRIPSRRLFTTALVASALAPTAVTPAAAHTGCGAAHDQDQNHDQVRPHGFGRE